MTEVDFNSILDTKADDIKSKPPLPIGSYKARISKLEPVKSSQKKTDGIEFTLIPLEALEDVDQEMLKDAGGLKDRTMRTSFWITPDSAIMLKEFLVNHVGLEGTGRTMRQLLGEALNQEVGIIVTHGTTKDGRQYGQIDRTFKIEG